MVLSDACPLMVADVQRSSSSIRKDGITKGCRQDDFWPGPSSAVAESKSIPVLGCSLREAQHGMNAKVVPPYTLVFVYGTLKRGFGNQWLMDEQILNEHACFVGTAETKEKFPLVCGPFQVPFLLNDPSHGHHVLGELYAVDKLALARLDDLEGVDKGHYERSSVVVKGLFMDASTRWMFANECIEGKFAEIHADAYFAASHYARKLLQAPHLKAYTRHEAATYRRRQDRPQNYTFLEHIQAWIDKQNFCNPER